MRLHDRARGRTGGAVFFLSIVKFTSPNSTKVKVWPISKPIPIHAEALAQLRLGFELDMPKNGFPDRLQVLVIHAMADGLLVPILPLDPDNN